MAKLLAMGYRTGEIAKELNISPASVTKYRNMIRKYNESKDEMMVFKYILGRILMTEAVVEMKERLDELVREGEDLVAKLEYVLSVLPDKLNKQEAQE